MLSFWTQGFYRDMLSFGIKAHHFFQLGKAVPGHSPDPQTHGARVECGAFRELALTWVKL